MKTWLSNCWESLRANFWFVPTLMAVAAIALSWVAINLDKHAAANHGVTALGWTFTRGPEGSRAVLSTVAGSMMTITSVTFSITIVALQLASSQFGPRLLRNFMRDRGNQVSLGTFIATFAYCLLILRTVNGTEDEQFVPHISVTIGLLLAFISLGVLIYFINHAAGSIQVENVIGNVSQDLDDAIARLYPESLGAVPPDDLGDPVEPRVTAGLDRESVAIAATRSDYLQAIDLDGLLDLAVKHDLIIRVAHRPGKFLVTGNDLAWVWPVQRIEDKLAGAIRGAFYLGRHRNLTQDIEFAIDQLVEIAVRALSPGVNDPFTAINCIDRLGEALVVLVEKKFPSNYRYHDGRLRVIVESSTIEGIINAAFDQIRQSARKDVAVTIRLLETIATVARRAQGHQAREALRGPGRDGSSGQPGVPARGAGPARGGWEISRFPPDDRGRVGLSDPRGYKIPTKGVVFGAFHQDRPT